MAEPTRSVMCPRCHEAIAVEPGWRLATCPRCGNVVTRMGEDSAYD